MTSKTLLKFEEIQKKIYTINGFQVMLDRDLAELYGVKTKRLNEQVKRNKGRFPEDFMFQLTAEQKKELVAKCDHLKTMKFSSTLPYAFSEQGVAMLSAVLKSSTAVEVSIQIMKAFVAMRHFLKENAHIFKRFNVLEIKQIETDQKMEKILDAIESKEIKPKQGIFFDGQIFDAYKFVSDIFRKAKKSIIIIDNYIDDTVLIHLTKKKKGVKVTIYTDNISEQLKLDIKKFNKQYPIMKVKELKKFHDRFIIIDENTVYHFGASLKDLGKKCFAFSKMDINAIEILKKLK